MLTALTYSAWIGSDKQSIRDAERLLSYQVADYLEENEFPIAAE